MAGSHSLGCSPEVEVVIDGEALGLRVGQLGVFAAIGAVRAAARAMQSAADEAASLAASDELCRAGYLLAEAAFGPEAAASLMGGERGTDAVRIARLARAVEAEMASPEARAAIAEAMRADETADEL